ncbi:MAG TPA: hypothetical protein VJ925_03340 [Longimicrobiales bacterium]|nr:hypothetical protein [Longimicrobiales bacterium]
MRSSAILLSLMLFVSCGGGDDPAPAAEAPPEEAALTVADFAGTWETMAMLEGTPDPVPTTLTGSADGSDWTMMLEGRDPVDVTASISGDSLILVSESYESVLREGVTVAVRTAGVMQDGAMVGKMVATYQTPEGEEVVSGTIEGTRGGM